MSNNPRLRRDNRIRTIHASLAIENNSLSLGSGNGYYQWKRILGAPDEKYARLRMLLKHTIGCWKWIHILLRTCYSHIKC